MMNPYFLRQRQTTLAAMVTLATLATLATLVDRRCD
jgi:hypothetical protein